MKHALISLLVLSSFLSAARAQELPPVVVPTPAEVAFAELHRIQAREPVLWAERDGYHVAGSATAVALCIPTAIITLVLGSVVLAFAGDSDFDDYHENRRDDYAVGAVLIGAGVAATVASVWGVRRLMKERRARKEGLEELRSFVERRALAEKLLESVALSPKP